MSLSVHRTLRADDNEFVDPPDPSQELAGPEAWRHTVYGSPAAVALGCTLLPQLRDHDLRCYDADVPLLLAEAELLLANLDHVSAQTGEETQRIAHRVGNIRDAALWAIEHGGGVIVW